ncbi:MAG: prolipoprotein diacylglyceryl transferase [Cyclobacteriaceae bacterium]|jgi:hypothetical protein|nr:prolipoprotein diacylglyceryl transferase [Cyclobacteriaceae bacterium]
MLDKLQSRWKLKSAFQVVVVLVVFACTGFTVLFLKEPVISFLVGSEDQGTLFTVLYYIFIFPIYNIILLTYGFIFGQFAFFWDFEKKMWSRMIGKKINNDAAQK